MGQRCALARAETRVSCSSYAPLLAPARSLTESERASTSPVGRSDARDLTARTCGECAACCDIPAVPSLNKPCNTLCANSTPGGCAIYADRPPECRAYTCLWLDSDLGEVGDRPDTLGLMFDRPSLVEEHPDYRDVPFVCAREVWAGARNGARAAELITLFARSWVVRLTRHGGRTELVGPKSLLDTLVRRAAARAAAEG